ncbi:DUF3987 domain-containing protein [Herminiimonas glaciei]|uniref:DUF3987 domain-containing protein n=1 Tax=Herminiimonas glaciei TaxID=523788 RepID=A0ABW2I687_9BURK|nr:DUF3987 domain-containing protein [Herminiimonas sp. KBW02]
MTNLTMSLKHMATYPFGQPLGGLLMPQASLSPPDLMPFPSHYYPDELGQMMKQLCGSGAIPPELVGTQLAIFCALAAQGVADVAWPNEQPMPVGISAVMGVGASTGKSFIEKILKAPFSPYREVHTDASGEKYGFLIEDASRESLIDSMREWPVAGLITDEAGMLKPLLRHAHTLAKLSDGSSLHHARKATGRTQVKDPRLVMLLMEQPDLFQETKIKLGAKKGGVGLINRCFVVSIPHKLSEGTYDDVKLSHDMTVWYEKKVTELMDASIFYLKGETAKRPILKLSNDALRHFKGLSQHASKQCLPGSDWFFISEYIGRHAERVLRLAAIFHVFMHGTSGEISLDTLLRAEGLGNWYIESFAQIAYEPPKTTQAEDDADKLADCFYQFFYQTRYLQFPMSDLRHTALSIGLTPTRVTRALATLGEQGRIRVFVHLKKPWVELNASRFPQY